ncbi:hypothetical protein JTE90_027652 [Oedothorax gibbosus]|uniref:Uncharacterized protein n=1 Tax=Oedothorax gibbosus TaxID=931172 RepID=A0AAV6USD5_9ARAC|nr:hypothetical protein JTE90_027652 [Oedothorax gibbosus]
MQIYETSQSPCDEQIESNEMGQANDNQVHEEVISDLAPPQTAPIQEVLVPESSFNFLQESQIDLDAPHMDPAVVAVHQMAPPTTNFPVYPSLPPPEEAPVANGHHDNEMLVNAAIPPIASSDFDPSHPIPTQTFTNQSFTVMQNMILPQAYVPVTMHHGPLPHLPVAVVPGPAVSAQPTVVPIPVPVAPVQEMVTIPNMVPGSVRVDAQHNMVDAQTNGISNNESDPHSNEMPAERGADGEGNGFPSYRGGFRGRGRGRGNFFRGRGNYNNNGRGGYQNHYYQDRNGYNGNFRRGNNRGGPRGGGTGNGNYRGRGGINYNKSQPSSQQQQVPQSAPQQQTQQAPQ